MNKLSKWLFGERCFRVLLLGEDGCGKTTFIHRLKFNEATEDPPPTADFYVETVTYPSLCEWALWESTRKLLPLIRKIQSPQTLVIWLHDCEGPTTLPWGFSSFLQEMRETGCRYIWVALNKQDTSGAKEHIQEIRRMYEKELDMFRNSISSRVLTHKLSGKTGEGLIEVLDEMHTVAVYRNFSVFKQMEESAPSKPETTEMDVEEMRSVIEKEIAEDTLDPDAFWELLMTGERPAWNHYNSLKAGYLIILESARRKNASQMAEDFKIHLNRLRKNAPEIFHNDKLPVFWILQLQHAIRQYRLHTMAEDLPSPNDFQRVLRHSPSLMNMDLWKGYYPYGPGFRPTAAPPLCLLPTDTYYLRDPAIVPAAEKGPDKLIRYAFAVLRYVRRSDMTRRDIFAQALATLQQTTMRLRTLDSSIPPYSETQTYFWLQMVHAALRCEARTEKSDALKTYDEFNETFELGETSWGKYYSEKLWNSIGARSHVVLPDIKPLPDVIALSGKKIDIQRPESSKTSELPSIEELSFRAAMIIHEAKESPSELPTPGHAHILFYLYTNLSTEVADPHKPLRLGQKANVLLTDVSRPMGSDTHGNFWIQQVGVAISHAVIDRGLSTFDGFITNNLHLVFEDLPRIYYSPGVWTSPAARDSIVAPDRRKMEMIVELSEIESPTETDNGTEGEDWVHV
ncbi:hypothetical protein BDW59DRAFT_161431 [Aspergillus cavernicola]|uniref:Uncharacterized protein n=1 Tax=Aspergillus cavernicola TaxID=176166 RepID=A0ABR4IDF0_9EURO